MKYIIILYITSLICYSADSTSAKEQNPTNVPQQYWTAELSHDTAEVSVQNYKILGLKHLQVVRDKVNGNTCYYWGGDFQCIPGYPPYETSPVREEPRKSIWWRRK